MNNMYDVVARIFRKGELGKSTKMAINWDKFLELIGSPKVRSDLAKGKLVGLLTHSGRDKCRASKLPHEDIALLDPSALWVLKDLWVEGDSVYGGMNFLKSTDGFKKFKDAVDAGTKPYVSISTELVVEDGKYVIKKIHSVDATLAPEFLSAEVTQLPVNFSEGQSPVNQDLYYSEAGDFSLREYIRERRLDKPYVFFRKRMIEVIRFIKLHNADTVYANHDTLIRYITSYLLEWIQVAYNTPEDKFNFITDLKLNNYLASTKELRQLQIYLNRAREEISRQKSITKNTQERLDANYKLICDGLIDYVNAQVKDKTKRL